MPFPEDKEAAGDQVYVSAPLTLNGIEDPLQMERLDGFTERTRFGLILTVTDAFPEQPF